MPAYQDKYRGNTVPLQQRERHARRNDRQIRAGSASKRAASVSSGGAVSDGRWQTRARPDICNKINRSLLSPALPADRPPRGRFVQLTGSPREHRRVARGTQRGRPGNTAGSPREHRRVASGNTAGSVNISPVVTPAGGDWAGIGDCYVDKTDNGAMFTKHLTCWNIKYLTPQQQ